MERARDVDEFLRSPVGRYVHAGRSVAWCATPSLVGCAAWGAPTEEDLETCLSVFEGYLHPDLAAQIDLVLDARRVERVSPEVIGTLIDWLSRRRSALKEKVHMQIGIIPDGILGVTLTGILPTLGETHPFRVVRSTLEALAILRELPHPDLAEEIDRIIESARGIPPWLDKLRELLRERKGQLNLDEAARMLALSTRTAQRLLQEHGTSFTDEAREVRYALARERILGSDDKIAAVAAEVGLSEGALTQLVRERTGSTPAELRRRQARTNE